MQIPTPTYCKFIVDFVDAVTMKPLINDLARSRQEQLLAVEDHEELFEDAA